MKRFIRGLMVWNMGLLLLRGNVWGMPARSYYELIIRKEPFGAMAAEHSNATDSVTAVDAERVREESNKIQLCAMTFTPDGRTAVGLIDNGVSPPAYITLFEGETANGLSLLFSDLDREIATFRRDGVDFTLALGLGLIETITPERFAQQQQQAEEQAARQAERERKKPNSLAEQLVAMQLSLPPDVEAPPLPIPQADPEDFTKKFDPNKEAAEPETEREALVQAGVEQLKEAMAAGESPHDYLQRLVVHRQEEVKRQRAEQQAAKAALEEQLAAGALSAEAQAQLRRQANIDLMKKGVEPLSPINDLTHEEQAAIDAALNAVQP